MPKMKTNRAAAKRFSLTATGKVKRNSAFRRHILVTKTTKMKRQARGTCILHEADARRVLRMLGKA
ncbi:50S ribosomal protein L35 [Candidatus Sumerlaeota bacterium]|nr:50S ribosomal protein L35 [Candidatus Sumerlaeales bacterium]NLD60954.1 50S ribosomal protein L35 [Candidatus Sumerlaeota bacterium]